MGHAVLESYSRVLESLANTVMNRIEDVLYADSLTQEPSPIKTSSRHPSMDLSASPGPGTMTPIEDQTPAETPTSMTLSDFMGWSLESGDSADMKKNTSIGNLETFLEDCEKKPSVISTKRFSYIDKLESGLRSPAARH